MRSFALALSVGLLLSFPLHGGLSENDQFFRGDTDNNGTVIAGDIDYLIDFLYDSGSAPECYGAADVNDDGDIDNADIVVLAQYVYNAVNNIPAPGPTECGEDPTSDPLGCELGPGCN